MSITKSYLWYASTDDPKDSSQFHWIACPFWPILVSEDHITVPSVIESPVYYKDLLKYMTQDWVVGRGVRMKFPGEKDVTLIFMSKKDQERFIGLLKAAKALQSIASGQGSLLA